MTTATLHPVADALVKIQAELSDYFKERRSPIEALTLAVLAKEHGFILGPPGTAKSMLIRTFFERFDGATYFEQLLSKTRPAEAVLGPYNIPELRDKGDFHRKTNGFLPTANFAMLDEVGKMSPALGHDLLAILNERILHEVNGGRSSRKVPLYSFIGGSNEVPTEEAEDAAALWDRILVRLTVDRLQESSNFADMLTSPSEPPAGTTVAFTDLADAIDNEVPKVKIPADVIETVLALKDSLRGEDIEVSDRRWRQSMKLLKAAAFLAGRPEATADDVSVLRHTLWETPAQIDKVERLTLQVSNPIAEKALALLEQTEEIAKEVRDAKGQSFENRSASGVRLNGNLKLVTEDLARVRKEAEAAGSSTTKLDEVRDRLKAVKRMVLTDMLGMDPSLIQDI